MNDYIGTKKEGILYFDNSRLPCKWTVMHRMKVRSKSFAGNMVARMYDYYFSGAVNFNKEFHKYYNKEYESITEYMEQHYNISHEDAQIMAAGSYSMKNCTQQSIERNIETLNYDSALKNAFYKAVGGINDEDQDRIYYE